MKKNQQTKARRALKAASGSFDAPKKSKYAAKKHEQRKGHYAPTSPFKPEIVEDDYTGYESFNNTL